MGRWSRTETEELLDLGRIVMMERMVCGRLVVVLGGDYGVGGEVEVSAFMNELDGLWKVGRGRSLRDCGDGEWPFLPSSFKYYSSAPEGLKPATIVLVSKFSQYSI